MVKPASSQRSTEKGAEVRCLLRLPAEAQRIPLVYSPMRGAEGELAVNSRSMLQIMGAFSSYLDVTQAHLDDHSAVPAFDSGPAESTVQKIRIHSGKERPAAAFAAVRYRDHWFWVDEGDWPTKRALTAVMFSFTLAESGGAERLPLVTIPAQ